MLRLMLGLIAVGVLTASTTDNTAWLAAGYPGMTVRFERTVKTDCEKNCDHYTLLLTFHGSVPTTKDEQSTWNTLADASCIDIVVFGKKSFACRQPGAMAGTTKAGEPYATSRFHVKREQLDALTNPTAVLKIQSLTVQLPTETRLVLAAFLRGGPYASAGN